MKCTNPCNSEYPGISCPSPWLFDCEQTLTGRNLVLLFLFDYCYHGLGRGTVGEGWEQVTWWAGEKLGEKGMLVLGWWGKVRVLD